MSASDEVVSVLAVDPGLRSGMAYWSCPGGFRSVIVDPEDTMDFMEAWANDHGPGGALVVESYRITVETGKKSQQHWPLELIGVARYLARVNRLLFVEQTPANAKQFCPDARLRQIGFWTPGVEDHARDAARHLALYLTRKRLLTVPPLEES